MGGSDFHQEMKDLVRFQKSVRSFISCLQSDENKQALSTRAKYFSHFKQLLEMGNSYLGICGLTRDKRSWFWEMLEEMKQRGRT